MKWISVEDRLPDRTMKVIVARPKGKGEWCVMATKYYENGGFAYPWRHEPTHWMPLPEPPEEST